MKKQIEVVLNTPTAQDRTFLSFWWDWKKEGRSRFWKKNSFDEDKWEASQTHIAIAPGANPRAAWKEAWRMVRSMSQNKGRGLHGYVIIDAAAHIDGEPLPLP